MGYSSREEYFIISFFFFFFAVFSTKSIRDKYILFLYTKIVFLVNDKGNFLLSNEVYSVLREDIIRRLFFFSFYCFN